MFWIITGGHCFRPRMQLRSCIFHGADFTSFHSDYLRACALKKAESWQSGLSGGDHCPTWPVEVTDLLKKLLTSKPPSSYNAAASELLRRCQFKTDRASIR